MEKQKCPEMRFKGFSGKWEEKTLGKSTEIFDNLRNPIAASDRIMGETPYYGANGIQGYIDGFTHDGEFALIAEDGANDLIDYPVQYVTGKIWVNNHAHVVKGIENILCTLFFVYRVKAMNIAKYLVGGGRAKLNASAMKQIEFYLPYFAEQTKIAVFFQILDQSIVQQEKKLTQTQNLKKAMLEKMFPKAGSKQPEIRLKGFEGDWEIAKIGDLFQVTSGSTPLRSDARFFENAKIDWVKTTDLNNGVINKTEEKISEIALTETSIKVLPKGTVFVAMYGGFNQIGRTGLLVSEATCNQALSAIYPNDIIESYFLLIYLNFKVNAWKDLAASSRKDPNITKSDVLAFSLIYPSAKEQVKISNFFKQLDDTLALQQQQLQTLKNLKQAFLEKMFV